MSKEAMKLARLAINNLIASSHATDPQHWRDARQDAVTALAAIDKALAQPPQQEPVGYVYSESGVKNAAIQRDVPNGTPLYTSPQPSQRKPLTDEQIDAAVKAWFENEIVAGRQPFAKRMRAAFAAAHGIKENT